MPRLKDVLCPAPRALFVGINPGARSGALGHHFAGKGNPWWRLLHASGLTAGRRITTHWAFVEALRGRAPDATVLEGVRYVRDGNLVTAAGVSAGIDMALWLVGQIWGVERARRTQRLMEYDPAPPYQAEV